ncbi:MAG: PaaI family thioesterase [Hyphomicrobiales bacterium]|nr:PaaI family thioesterase [Hyphomicrobiales bacterium]
MASDTWWWENLYARKVLWTTGQAVAEMDRILPCTMDNVEEVLTVGIASWVRAHGLEILEVEEGRMKARLRQDLDQQLFTGGMCGQATMSAIDTVMSLAMLTFPRKGGGTASQNNQFLRAAIRDDLIIEAMILKMRKNTAYEETRIVFEGSGDLVVHSTSVYAF